MVQRQVLYLGEINRSQREAWRRTIEVFEEGAAAARTMALFPEDRPVEVGDRSVVRIRLKEVELRRPRQWGGCWLACQLYEQLGLDKFWAERLPPNLIDRGIPTEEVLQEMRQSDPPVSYLL